MSDVREALPAVLEGMLVEWDVPIEMDDGAVVRADVFRPVEDGLHPVILSYGTYGKGRAFQEHLPEFWATLANEHPDAVAGSTNRFQVWETVDPEKFVPDGYACVRVDSRGAGRSPGYWDPFNAREAHDLYACIEWAGTQEWSNGKVGLCGISYYASNQWQVAALQPPHLAAICPWEGWNDFYRDQNRHGGILSPFIPWWQKLMVEPVQSGVGEAGIRSTITGELVSGPETLSPEELADNRAEPFDDLRSRELFDDWYAERSADPSRIVVPLLSATNWAHQLHSRGNYEGYLGASSQQKWLEVHGYEHWVEFYTDYGVQLQKRFFGHFLKGEDTGWEKQPPVQLQIRHVDGTFHQRGESEWPIARTQWTKLYLDLERLTLEREPPAAPASVSFEALGDGLTFLTEPLAEETEILGPMAAKLYVSSTTRDADLFVVLRVLDPTGKDVTFANGVGDPNGVLTNGWLRASHRKLDPVKSTFYRPWHTHDELQPLAPGQTVEVDVEIWPTSIVVPAGYRIGLAVLGKDFELPGEGPWPGFGDIEFRGNGMVFHNDPEDRPADVFGGTTTLFGSSEEPVYLLLPIMPSEQA